MRLHLVVIPREVEKQCVALARKDQPPVQPHATFKSVLPYPPQTRPRVLVRAAKRLLRETAGALHRLQLLVVAAAQTCREPLGKMRLHPRKSRQLVSVRIVPAFRSRAISFARRFSNFPISAFVTPYSWNA